MRDKRDRTLEDQLRSAVYESRTRPDEPDSPKEIMRRARERMKKKIDEIFSER